MIDTSQKGDWENWRNETLNGQTYDFDEKIASEGGLDYGILEFDYVSTNMDQRLIGLPAMPQEVFELFLHELQQVKLVVRLNPAAQPKRKKKGKKSSGYGSNLHPSAMRPGAQSTSAQPRGKAMMQAAMADGSVDDGECRSIFRKFDADGSGELDTK